MMNVLIAGKEFPAGVSFAQAAQECGRNVVLTSEDKPVPAENLFVVEWNKSSPISSKSVIINAEIQFVKIDEAVLFFDAPWYADRYRNFSVKDLGRALDDMLACYMHMTLELLSRFSKKRAGTLIFLLKESGEDAGILTQTAQAAFSAFAKNIASANTDESISVFLLQGTHMQQDAELAKRLFSCVDEKRNEKNPAQWIKLGAKQFAGFPFFKRR